MSKFVPAVSKSSESEEDQLLFTSLKETEILTISSGLKEAEVDHEFPTARASAKTIELNGDRVLVISYHGKSGSGEKDVEQRKIELEELKTLVISYHESCKEEGKNFRCVIAGDFNINAFEKKESGDETYQVGREFSAMLYTLNEVGVNGVAVSEKVVIKIRNDGSINPNIYECQQTGKDRLLVESCGVIVVDLLGVSDCLEEIKEDLNKKARIVSSIDFSKDPNGGSDHSPAYYKLQLSGKSVNIVAQGLLSNEGRKAPRSLNEIYKEFENLTTEEQIQSLKVIHALQEASTIVCYRSLAEELELPIEESSFTDPEKTIRLAIDISRKTKELFGDASSETFALETGSVRKRKIVDDSPESASDPISRALNSWIESPEFKAVQEKLIQEISTNPEDYIQALTDQYRKKGSKKSVNAIDVFAGLLNAQSWAGYKPMVGGEFNLSKDQLANLQAESVAKCIDEHKELEEPLIVILTEAASPAQSMGFPDLIASKVGTSKDPNTSVAVGVGGASSLKKENPSKTPK
jgi:hypothetical protein